MVIKEKIIMPKEIKKQKGYNGGENFDSETYLRDALSINFLQ